MSVSKSFINVKVLKLVGAMVHYSRDIAINILSYM